MRIIEVGPRDGLQNEALPVPTELKRQFIADLAVAGLKEIEVTSFVSPKWVPQLADAAEVLADLPDGVLASVLVPNQKGLERALALGVRRIALFTAASDGFTLKNINMTVDESLAEFERVMAAFRKAVPDGWVRGYVSTIVECPVSGPVAPKKVASVSERLLAMGCDEVALGETLGVAVPRQVKDVIAAVAHLSKERVAWHFHDTRGTAIANVAVCLEAGYTAFDASAAGLGGCPYAKGAGGNLATEDLIYFLEQNGIKTGVDPVRLAQASLPVLQHLGRAPFAKAQLASLAE